MPVPAEQAPASGTLHAAFVMFGVFVYSGARISLNSAGAIEEPGAPDPLNGIFQLILLAGGLFFAFRYRWRCLALLPRAWPLLLTFGVILASVLWSEAPGHTLRRSVSALVLVLYVLTAFAGAGGVGFMRLALATLLLIALGSLGEAVLRPGVGWDVGDYANAIRGLYNQKNGLGMAMLSATLALSFLVLQAGRPRIRDGAVFLVLLGMLVLSRSTTSTILALATGVATLLLLGLLRGGAWRLAATMGLLAAVVVAGSLGPVVDRSSLFDFIGKDASLTGRTLIWEAVEPMIERHPWLGHGYAAFWIAETDRVQAVWRFIDWKAPSAHSGTRDVMLQLGWLGIGLLAVLLAGTGLRVLRAFRRGRRAAALWMLAFVAVQAVLSNSESTLLNLDLSFVAWMMMGLHLAGPLARRITAPQGVPVRQGRIVQPPFSGGAMAPGLPPGGWGGRGP